MKILEVYQKYQNMPQLVNHQLKVAAVAGLICDNFRGEINKENIIKACLLHDVGNIVKFDFNYRGLLDQAEEERLPYWQQVQQQYIAKYGSNSHTVTMAIIKEIGVSKEVQELVDCIGFGKGKENAGSSDYNKKICAYSDMRVGPFGVVSLEERMADLRVRYKSHPEGAQDREAFEEALRKIEQQVFAHCRIAPADIAEQVVLPVAEGLRGFEI